MYIEINDATTLREIQEVFSNFYPYMRIEFYRKHHKKYEESEAEDWINPDTAVGTIKDTHISGILEMRPDNKIAAIEKEFRLRFGLSAQIFRKEKNEWEQTTGMDDFTLKETNELGRNSSDELITSEYNEDIKNGELP